MPTPSKRYVNWTGVSFASTAINGVRRIGFNLNLSTIEEGADMDQGPTFAVVNFSNPTFDIMTYNAALFINQAAGTYGVFTATLADGKNRAITGGGGMVFTTNALSYVGSNSLEGDYNQLATDTVQIKTAWTDGVTNPVTVSAV